MTAQGQQHSTADELFLPAIHAYLSGFQVQPVFMVQMPSMESGLVPGSKMESSKLGPLS